MIVLLDWKRFEPALPDMAARVVPPVIPSDMRRQQPLHPSTQLPIVGGPEREMKMIGHETVRQHAHGNTLGCLAQQIHKRLVVPIRMKHLGPGVAPIDHVVTIVSD
jgi:hypothetical protein